MIGSCCRGACVTLHKNMFSPRSKPKVAAMADTVCRTSDSTDSQLDEEDPRPFLFFSHHVCGPCGSAFDPVCGPPWQQSEHLHKVTCPLVTVTRLTNPKPWHRAGATHHSHCRNRPKPVDSSGLIRIIDQVLLIITREPV